MTNRLVHFFEFPFRLDVIGHFLARIVNFRSKKLQKCNFWQNQEKIQKTEPDDFSTAIREAITKISRL